MKDTKKCKGPKMTAQTSEKPKNSKISYGGGVGKGKSK